MFNIMLGETCHDMLRQTVDRDVCALYRCVGDEELEAILFQVSTSRALGTTSALRRSVNNNVSGAQQVNVVFPALIRYQHPYQKPQALITVRVKARLGLVFLLQAYTCPLVVTTSTSAYITFIWVVQQRQLFLACRRQAAYLSLYLKIVEDC